MLANRERAERNEPRLRALRVRRYREDPYNAFLPRMSLQDDAIVETAIEVRSPLAVVAGLPLFRDLDPELLGEIASEIEWFSLPGGTTLFEAGEPADAVQDAARLYDG